MNREAELFIDQYKEHIEKQKDYVVDSDWSTETKRDLRKSSHDTIYKVVKSSLGRLKFFMGLVDDRDRKFKKVINFIELIVTLIRAYDSQCNYYLKIEDWTTYQEHYSGKELEENRNDEIDFQNSILENLNKINTEIAKLNLDDAVKEVLIPLYADKLAPFLMSDFFINRYPVIPKYLDQNDLGDVFNRE